jgi:hypothetical protein
MLLLTCFRVSSSQIFVYLLFHLFSLLSCFRSGAHQSSCFLSHNCVLLGTVGCVVCDGQFKGWDYACGWALWAVWYAVGSSSCGLYLWLSPIHIVDDRVWWCTPVLSLPSPKLGAVGCGQFKWWTMHVAGYCGLCGMLWAVQLVDYTCGCLPFVSLTIECGGAHQCCPRNWGLWAVGSSSGALCTAAALPSDSSCKFVCLVLVVRASYLFLSASCGLLKWCTLNWGCPPLRVFMNVCVSGALQRVSERCATGPPFTPLTKDRVSGAVVLSLPFPQLWAGGCELFKWWTVHCGCPLFTLDERSCVWCSTTGF